MFEWHDCDNQCAGGEHWSVEVIRWLDVVPATLTFRSAFRHRRNVWVTRVEPFLGGSVEHSVIESVWCVWWVQPELIATYVENMLIATRTGDETSQRLAALAAIDAKWKRADIALALGMSTSDLNSKVL